MLLKRASRKAEVQMEAQTAIGAGARPFRKLSQRGYPSTCPRALESGMPSFGLLERRSAANVMKSGACPFPTNIFWCQGGVVSLFVRVFIAACT